MTWTKTIGTLGLALLLLSMGGLGAAAGEDGPVAVAVKVSHDDLAKARVDVAAQALDLLRMRMEGLLARGETLRELDRHAEALEVYESLETAYQAGFENLDRLLTRLERRAPRGARPRVVAIPDGRISGVGLPAEDGISDEPFQGPAANAPLRIRHAPGGAFRERGGAAQAVPAGGGSRATVGAVELALKWLAAHQSPDGGWEADGFGKWCDGKPVPQGPDGAGKALYGPGVTGLALTAFLGAGYTNRGRHPFAKVVSKGLRYLKNVQDAEGCFGPRTSQHFIYNHACAALAMVEAYGMTGSPIFKGSAQKALDFIALTRNPYFAWRYGVKPGDNDTSVTGWMMMALKSAQLINEDAVKRGKPAPLTIDEEAFHGIRAWLDKMTEPEYGRVGYIQRGGAPARPMEMIDKFPGDKSESMTGVGILARVFLGDDPRKSELIQKGADLCSKMPPVWNPTNGSIDMYYWYYATLALFQVGGQPWKTWNEHMKPAIRDSQRQDTTPCLYKGSWDPIGPWGPDGGRVYATAMMAMCLEVYYRYDRVYGTR